MPLTSILRPKHPAGIINEGLYGGIISFNEVTHNVSCGIYQGDLVLFVPFFHQPDRMKKQLENAINRRCGIE